MSANSDVPGISKNPVIMSNPIDPSTWNLNQTLRNLRVLHDDQGNAIGVPVFLINPSVSPIKATGAQVTLVDSNNNFVSVNESTPFGDNHNQPGSSNNLLFTLAQSYPYLFNGSTYDRAAYPNSFVSGTATASTTTLVSGVSNKKVRYFSLGIALQAIKATGCSVQVKEHTSGNVIAQIVLDASSVTSDTTPTLSLNLGGMPGSLADGADLVATGASCTGSASLTYNQY